MSFLPSFLLSLELFTALQPQQQPLWAADVAIAPTSCIVMETAVKGEDDMITSWSGRLTGKVAQTSLAISGGHVSAGGIITAMATPLPAPLGASHQVSFTQKTATTSLPVSAGTTGHYPLVLQLDSPHLQFFYAEKDTGAQSGGAGASFTGEQVSCSVWGAINRTTLSEKTVQGWFSTCPYVPQRDLYTTLVAGRISYGSPEWSLTVEEAVGREKAQGIGWIESGRWFSRSTMSFSGVQDRLMLNGQFFICDLDYETMSGKRLRDTVRAGVSSQYTGYLPDFLLADTTWKLGAAGTGTWHCPDTVFSEPYTAQQYELYLAIEPPALSAATTVTCELPTPEDTYGSVSASQKMIFDGGGVTVSADVPLLFTSTDQLATGELTVFLTPWPQVRLETTVAVTETDITGLSGKATVRTGPVKHSGSATFNREKVSCSYSASAKW